MSVLYWLLVPVGVTCVAILVLTWVNRAHRASERYDQVKQFHRFCEAMEDDLARPRTVTERNGVHPISRAVE